jgi:hypothetical protein
MAQLRTGCRLTGPSVDWVRCGGGPAELVVLRAEWFRGKVRCVRRQQKGSEAAKEAATGRVLSWVSARPER